MDRFLVPKDGRDLKRKAEGEVGTYTRNAKTRKYDHSYLDFGFTCITVAGEVKPQCVICGATLANDSLKPTKLRRHLETKHADLAKKTRDFFVRQLQGMKKQKETVKSVASVPANALKASYHIAYFLGKNKKPFTDAEKVILPTILAVNRVMLGESAAEKCKSIPMSDTTICRRIADLSSDISTELVLRLKDSQFALQLDEATDISKEAHLIAYVRYCHGKEMLEDFLFCKQIKGRATAPELFEILNNFLSSNCLKWEACVGICTDGAPSMCGARAGLKAKVLAVAPHIVWTHCMIHREALAVRNMGHELTQVLTSVVKIVNFIKMHPTRARLFATLCAEMGADHDALLFHTEVRWLSRGKVLNRIYELRNEVRHFLLELDQTKAEPLCDPRWLILLAYLGDIFEKLNFLNLSLQGTETTSFAMNAKISAFKKKLELWRRRVDIGIADAFPLLEDALEETEYDLSCVSEVIGNHLNALRTSLEKYFPDDNCNMNDWVVQPFLADVGAHLPIQLQEELMELQSDRLVESQFRKLSLGAFWQHVSAEYPTLSKCAVNVLLPFSTSYLCEIGFSALAALKTKYRSKLEVEESLRLAIGKIEPNIDRLAGERQAHPSH